MRTFVYKGDALPDIIGSMGIKAEYRSGVFKPLEEVSDAAPGKIYQVFAEDELRWLQGGISRPSI